MALPFSNAPLEGSKAPLQAQQLLPGFRNEESRHRQGPSSRRPPSNWTHAWHPTSLTLGHSVSTCFLGVGTVAALHLGVLKA